VAVRPKKGAVFTRSGISGGRRDLFGGFARKKDDVVDSRRNRRTRPMEGGEGTNISLDRSGTWEKRRLVGKKKRKVRVEPISSYL